MQTRCRFSTWRITLLATTSAVLAFLILSARNHARWNSSRCRNWYDADNKKGFRTYIVPNIVHYVRFGESNLTFWEAVSLRSAYLNHGPDLIMIHCDDCRLMGPYAKWVFGIPVLRHVRMSQVPKAVAEDADGVRAKILTAYGGISLANDVFVIRHLHHFRRFEMTVGSAVSGQVLIGHRCARLLRLQRFYNGTREKTYWHDVVTNHSHLVHWVRNGLADVNVPCRLWGRGANWAAWPGYLAVQLTEADRQLCELDPLRNQTISDVTVHQYDTVAGQMARSVLFGTADIVGEDSHVLPVRELREIRDSVGANPRPESASRSD